MYGTLERIRFLDKFKCYNHKIKQNTYSVYNLILKKSQDEVKCSEYAFSSYKLKCLITNHLNSYNNYINF